jgi:hypothetical protein
MCGIALDGFYLRSGITERNGEFGMQRTGVHSLKSPYTKADWQSSANADEITIHSLACGFLDVMASARQSGY